MPRNCVSEKECADCKKLITFKDFCKINPSISLRKAFSYWNDSKFLIYCSECYFKIPEKPFRLKTDYFNYYYRIRRNSK